MRSVRLGLLFVLLALASPAQAQSLHDLGAEEVKLDRGATRLVGKTAAHTFESARVEAPFTGVAVQGVTGDRDVEGFVRFDVGGAWGPWQPLYLTLSATDGFFMGAFRDGSPRRGVRFELRFDVRAGARFDLHGAGTFDERADADRADADRASADDAGFPVQHFRRDGLIDPPHLIPRRVWNAAPFRGTPSALARPSYNYITLHHAAGFGATTYEQGLAQVKAIQDFHQNGRGWSDIGYQFVLNEIGHVYQGRPFLTSTETLEDEPVLAMGAHVGGANTGNIGVCLLGCYHPPETSYPCNDVMGAATLDSLVTLMAFLAERYEVDPANIRGHRDFGSTACPGNNNYQLLPTIRARVAQLLEEGNAPLAEVTLAATADDEGVVTVSWEFVAVRDVVEYRIVRNVGGVETQLYASEEVVPARFTDGALDGGVPVEYRLEAVSSAGRTQTLAVTEVALDLPTDYVLAGGFPNPFNPTTTIRFYLPRADNVSLRVYDPAGREVAVLAEGALEGERWHTVTLDASGLPSGVYFYRLTAEGFTGTAFDRTRSVVLVN